MANVNLFEVADRASSLTYFKKKYNVQTDEQLQQLFKKAYYEGNALITDGTYDRLFPNDTLGYSDVSSAWPKFKHLVEATQMIKYKKLEDAQQYIKEQNFDLQAVEYKLDGINLKLYYEQGKLVHAVTRGSGVEGEDILNNAIKFKQIPQTINLNKPFIIEGEIVISEEDFNQIKTNTDYANRRNAVSGIARRYDGQYSNLLSFYAYTIYEFLPGGYKKKDVTIGRNLLKSFGFTIPDNQLDYGKSLEDLYKDAGAIRDTNPKHIVDGLVLKSNTDMFALKFPANTAETTVIGYRWELGTTYKLIPVVLYETVNIGGANYTKASLASAQNFVNINAPIGSTVEIARANEVIPYLKQVVARSGNKLEIPEVCPECGEPLSWSGAHLICTNDECPSRLASKCQRMMVALSVKGFSMGTINKLVDLGIVTEAPQILTLTAEQLMGTGKSQRVATNMANAIHERVKEFDDAAIVFALNLPGISWDQLAKVDTEARKINRSLIGLLDDYGTPNQPFVIAFLENILKYSKAKVVTDFMVSANGKAYYNKIKTIVQNTKA